MSANGIYDILAVSALLIVLASRLEREKPLSTWMLAVGLGILALETISWCVRIVHSSVGPG